tara:strand:+ start:252 stop:503 length:252 start_codon:yes stop_codon:yes gene_type:complete
MAKLSCGCIPDASGYGYCGECTRMLRQKIWANMSEKRKNYDRHFAPEQSRELDDALNDFDNNRCCSCHINAPCGYCMNSNEEV